jgi:hypothetical protein
MLILVINIALLASCTTKTESLEEQRTKIKPEELLQRLEAADP